MSDQGFNFAPPPPRRERKQFEPPPWERDQFDQLAKERAVAEEQSEEGREPAQQQAGPVSSEDKMEDGAAQEAAEPDTVDQPVITPVAVEAKPEFKKTSLDDIRVTALMFELRAEEASATQGYAKATLAAGATLLLIGTVLVIWSIVMIVVAARRPEQGRAGVFIGLMVLLFGVGFAGTGAWFVFKTLRQQGVL